MFKFNSAMPTLHIIIMTSICEWTFFMWNEYIFMCVRVYVSFMFPV